ncbi:amino acid ABC transporter permease [Undibacterium sp. Ji49W]|uniref:amino acid ABC transporter permease n=1 Tax=Undibacterium sp. Ji49W TaxID=3413040 RepID=UPI003BF370E8
MNYQWNWNIYWEDALDGGGTYFDTLIWGVKVTLALAMLAWIIALVLGSIIGTMRTTQNKWLVRLSNGYIELFRNIPLLVQMFIWYFVIPELVPDALGMWMKNLPNVSFYTAVISLGLFTSARVAVQVSTGINALPRGQKMAGTALGLTQIQTYRYVLLPMAFRIITPSLTNEVAAIIKNSSVASTITVLELMSRTRSMNEFTYKTFEAFTAATLIYLFVSVAAIMLSNFLERKLAVPGFITGGAAKGGR